MSHRLIAGLVGAVVLLSLAVGCARVKRAVVGETPAEKVTRLEQLTIDAELMEHLRDYSGSATTILELKDMAVTLGKLRMVASVLEGSAGLQEILEEVATAGFVALLLESTGIIEAIDRLIRYTNQMADIHSNLSRAFESAILEPDDSTIRELADTVRGTRQLLVPAAEVVAVVANWLGRFMTEWRFVNAKLSACSAFSLGLKGKACWVLESCSEPLEELAGRHLEARVSSLDQQLQGDLETLATLSAELESGS